MPVGRMSRVAAAVVAALSLVCALGVPASAAPRSDAPSVQVLLAQINSVRVSHGLAPLRLSPALSRAAAVHSTEMARNGYFGHESANGSSFDKRIARFYASRGWQYWSVGENLVAGCPDIDVDTAIQTWLDSPPHRETLLAARFREIGLSAVHVPSAAGVYDGDSVTIITADFGVRR